MNANIQKVLIIGGGFSGMSAAIELSKRGIKVDLVEKDPQWRTDGAGISLNGASLRLFKQMGLLEAFIAVGGVSDGVELRGPDDSVIATLPTPRLAGPDTPGSAGIMRPAMAEILKDALKTTKTNVRLGLTFSKIEDQGEAVKVTFSDGSAGEYDLVIGADGLFSATRQALLPDAPTPQFVGQSVWRAVLPRPEGVTTVTMWMGPKLKVGVNVISKDDVYLFLTEDHPVNDHVPQEEQLGQLKALLAKFESPIVRGIGEALTEDNLIVYRPLEGMLVRGPWHKGRIVLIGDAVHATTPHLAAGACIGMEDAFVLGEEIERADTLPDALDAFQARRFERCRMVVDNSARLAEIEINNGDRAEHAQIMRESMMILAQPI